MKAVLKLPRSILMRAAAKVADVLPAPAREWLKEQGELEYWASRYAREGTLANNHYEYFFTTFFGLDKAEYKKKRILDIGCGPRGSLEWADEAEDRIGIDPLANSYRAFGVDQHRMDYIQARSESIPYPNRFFDVVSAFNSLDHVKNVWQTMTEISRVLRPGGTLLLIVEVNHRPTITEPHSVTQILIEGCVTPYFQIVHSGLTEIRQDHDIYQSLRDNKPYGSAGPGILYARYRRNANALPTS